MTQDATPRRCTAPDGFGPGRCPEGTTPPSSLCGGHVEQATANREDQSLILVDGNVSEAPILREMRWVAIEARELMSAETDPERIARFEDRKRALLDALREW